MKVMVDIAFKSKDTFVRDRIHHLYFPAYLETSDGCLETKGLELEMGEIIGMSIDCSDYPLEKAEEAVKRYGKKCVEECPGGCPESIKDPR